MIHLRGKVIPVIALRKRFGLEPDNSNTQPRIVVLEVQDMVLGFLVDSVPEVSRTATDAVVPPPRFGVAECDYITGMAKLQDGLAMLLDVDRIMAGKNTQTKLVHHG